MSNQGGVPAPFSFGPGEQRVVWGPSPQYAAQLTTHVTFDRYSMRLPQGFVFQSTPQELKQSPTAPGIHKESYSWVGPSMANGARGAMGAGVITLTGNGKVSPQELPQMFAILVSKMPVKAGLTGFRSDPPEQGQLAGRESIRAKFSASVMGIQVQGIAYLILDGDKRVIETCSLTPAGCTDPPADVLDACVLTMQ